jgi:PQQ-dependent dehydrogenase (methanol/ethanol family)
MKRIHKRMITLFLKGESRRTGRLMPGAFALALAILSGRPSSSQTLQATAGGKIYAKQCSGCHGVDARGGEYGPPLAGNSELRDHSVSWLRALIRNGVPKSGMPAFHLPAGDLDALAALIHSLNSPAAENRVPGDRAAGEKYFFGEGQCATCHMVDGRGSGAGPDLSDVAQKMTVADMQTSLLQPSANLAPGYQMVTVRLRDGKTVHGFARSRSNFEIVVQDLKGQFHLLQNSEVSSIDEDPQSQMPPVKAGKVELQNLVAFLSGLTGVKPGTSKAEETSEPGNLPFSRILHPRPGDWLTYNGDLSGNRYNELAQINTSNAKQLRLKWVFTVPLWKQLLPDTSYFHLNMQYFGLEVVPLVADGVMYATGPQRAYALDARTGQEIWSYSRPRTSGLVGDASLGTNRGMAILGDKVFRVTDNAHLIALNRTTGKLMWEVVMPDEPMKYGSTVAPLVVKNMVIAGVSGGDWGMRGFLAAYKASSGERVWRHWTIPTKGEPGAESWGGNPPKTGGSATWLTGSYDPETNTLYWATGNPYPDSDDSARPGDDLYTSSILALNPDNGKLRWYYQVTPHDVNDWDANAPLVLIDTMFQGRERKLLLHADKNGFFYVLDRTDGHVLLAKPFVRVTWASGIGPDGRPQLRPDNGLLCPGDEGTNWNGTAFSPQTGFYYLAALEKCAVSLSAGSWKQKPPKEEPAKKFLEALDISTGKVAWKVQERGPAEGKRDAGVLATAGGLLFFGDPSGNIVAVDARNGKTLWHFATNGESKASPMTYTVNGKQYVALAVGSNIFCFGLP